ncbi:hypothetical protein F53441_2427 [Fusarium austroafricanum]|uniref:Uncharacterized protein n=1 Tax=Fusarium austroafricanum TaxID=2364996 RepID=A0A8H4NXU5_9HYPO|nr:hypothetical protein F53441_2427 [Fusarium austroafricanum]
MSASNLQDVSLAVVDIFGGDVDGAEVVVEHAVEDRLMSLLNVASTVDDTEYDAAIDNILDTLEAAGESVFSQQNPTSNPRLTSLDDLHSVLYPETPNFQLKTVNGIPNLIPIRPSESYAVLDHRDGDGDVGFDISDWLPQYSSKDVLVWEVIVRERSLVSRVLVNE